jgi:hypothetical protein
MQRLCLIILHVFLPHHIYTHSRFSSATWISLDHHAQTSHQVGREHPPKAHLTTNQSTNTISNADQQGITAGRLQGCNPEVLVSMQVRAQHSQP